MMLFVFGLSSPFTEVKGGEWCCGRTALFLPIKMPKGQEVDATFYISAAWYGALRKSDILDCPLEYEEHDYGGRKNLNSFDNQIANIVGTPLSNKDKEIMKNFLDMDYVWKATLTLNHATRIISGKEVEGYAGAKNYQKGYIEGNWTFHIQLINIQFNEVVREGSITFNGTAQSGCDTFSKNGCVNAYKKLARSKFSPIDDIILAYEKVPRSANVKPKEDEICPGDTTVINVTKITDSKGENSKPWQRVVVEVKEGKILNGVKCHDSEKCYAFLVDNGNIKVKYKAPDKYDIKKDTIKVYNACAWGQEDVRPLRITSSEDKIGETEITIKTPERFKMKYHHTMTLQYGQFLLKSTGKGKIPCSINWQKSPPSIKCDGRVTADWKGHAGPCKFDGDSSFGLHYKGHVALSEDSPSKIIIEKTGDDKLGGNFKITCRGIVQNIPEDFPIPALEEDRKLEFDLKSGGTKSFTVPGGTKYSYSIDLKCKKKTNK